MTKKALIIDNEANRIGGFFKLFNILHTNNSLLIDTLQDIKPENIDTIVNNYDFLLVDLSLSINSIIDGKSLIEKIFLTENHIPTAVITGKSNPSETLTSIGISDIFIFEKPLNLGRDLSNLKKFFQLS